MLNKTAQIIPGNLFKVSSSKDFKIADKKNDRFKVAADCIGSTPSPVLIIQILLYMKMTKKLLYGKASDSFLNLGVFGLGCLNIQSLTRFWGYSNLIMIFSMSSRFLWKVHFYLLSCFLRKNQVDDELKHGRLVNHHFMSYNGKISAVLTSLILIR